MSGSPKYSQAEIEARRLREIEERVRREAELAHQRRIEEEARLLRAQLEQTRLVVMRSVNSIIPLAERAAHGALARYLPATFDQLGSVIAAARTAVTNAPDAGSLAAAARHLEAISKTVQQMVASAKEAQHRIVLESQRNQLQPQIESTLLRIGTILSQHTRHVRKQHDPDGFEAIEQRHASINRYADAGDLKSALGVAQSLVSDVQGHATRVTEQEEKWKIERDALRAHATKVLVRFDALSRDEVIMAWVAPEIRKIHQEQQALLRALDSDDFERIRACYSNMETQLADAVTHAQNRQIEAEKRQYIVDGLVNVLQSQGFAVSHPQLADQDDFGSTVIVRAVRPDRRAVDVQVPIGGRVEYDVDGYARRVEQQNDGTITNSCNEAEERLEQLHSQLVQDFGIQMGELSWDTKEPLRKQHNAQELPTSGTTNKGLGV